MNWFDKLVKLVEKNTEEDSYIDRHNGTHNEWRSERDGKQRSYKLVIDAADGSVVSVQRVGTARLFY